VKTVIAEKKLLDNFRIHQRFERFSAKFLLPIFVTIFRAFVLLVLVILVSGRVGFVNGPGRIERLDLYFDAPLTIKHKESYKKYIPSYFEEC
jgi:hypothetical protein